VSSCVRCSKYREGQRIILLWRLKKIHWSSNAMIHWEWEFF
jgi:hypothetical protein